MRVTSHRDTIFGRGRSLHTPIVVIVGLLAMARTIDADVSFDNEECGLWLGPSPIKEAEDHGWGHSLFTGKLIKEGTLVLGSGALVESDDMKIYGDIMVPIYDWELLDMASVANWDKDYWLDDDNTENREQEYEKIRARLQEELGESRSMDPPLFHNTWDGVSYPLEMLESKEGMRTFVSGPAVLSPCTWNGFNLEQVRSVSHRDWRKKGDDNHDETPPKPQAGSFSYLSNAMWRASRDIRPGEELIVECTDNSDNFDASKYGPTKFQPKEAGGYSICLDDKVEIRLADHTSNIAGGSYGGQRGLFAKRKLGKDETLTSTPMIPIHKEEMTMEREKYASLIEDLEVQGLLETFGVPPKKQQLLLNYLFGNPESSLLWLPMTPHLLAVNHAPRDQNIQPNARLQWHKTDVYPDTIDGKPLSRRQKFHHEELLKMDSNEVALKHGMGLMVDLVALRDIKENEEILIDYGKAWDDAWKEHNQKWDTAIKGIQSLHAEEKLERKLERRRRREERELDGQHKSRVPLPDQHHQKHIENSMTALPLSSYVTADDYNELHGLDELRTVTEQRRNPYPSNLETACFFESDWLSDRDDQDELADGVTFESWYHMNGPMDECLLPCLITERRNYVPGEESQIYDDDDFVVPEEDRMENGGSETSQRYTVKLTDPIEENTSIPFECHIYKKFEYYLLDVPREGIIFANKIHSTDQWIDQAFRQPVGLPDDMVPNEWKDLSRRKGTRGGTRKKKAPPKKQMTEEEEEGEKNYIFSVKKWTEADSRRDLLEEMQDKWLEKKYAPLYDL